MRTGVAVFLNLCFTIEKADCSMAIFQFTGVAPHVMMIHGNPLDWHLGFPMCFLISHG